ncbi:hypothetical protein HRU45_03365, partial [Candidatus Dependentiae bacterium]|nr:hypothetical protein [Candidatus Dependentiae bacterium]
ILSFKKGAPLALAVLIGFIVFSNAFVALSSYFTAWLGLSAATCLAGTQEVVSLVPRTPLIPFTEFNMPGWVSVSSVYALFNAVILGIIFSFGAFLW